VPVRAERLSNNPRINRGAPLLYGVLGALAFIVSLLDCGPRYFAAQKKAAAIVPLQGIWLVDEFSASGGPQHSLFTKPIADELHIAPGEDRWTKLIFDGPDELVIQSINGELDYVVIKLDKSNTSAQLSDDGDKDWKGHLTLQQPQQGLLDLQGEVNGMVISARLHKMDESRFPLTNERMQLIE